MSDTLASLLQEAVDQEEAWVTAEREHVGGCDWCEGGWVDTVFRHEPTCWLTRARMALAPTPGDATTEV